MLRAKPNQVLCRGEGRDTIHNCSIGDLDIRTTLISPRSSFDPRFQRLEIRQPAVKPDGFSCGYFQHSMRLSLEAKTDFGTNSLS